jgi:dTDP-4-dehydrorhamnose reductase
MLAQALEPLLPDAVFLGHAELDVTDPDKLDRVFTEHEPDLVFNLAAFTRVDDAEAHEQRATEINGLGAGNVARACVAHGARLIHVSTDYVFNGSSSRPWLEEDKVGPLSAYGRSKLVGEDQVEAALPDSLIVRTAWLYGAGGPNFVDTMLRLASERDEIRVVDDQIGSPTWTRELASALVPLAEGGFRGLCHWACSGQTSWHGFAARILERAGWRGRLVAISSAELKRPAPRPAYSVLDTRRASAWLGREPRPWQQALDGYLDERLGTERH